MNWTSLNIRRTMNWYDNENQNCHYCADRIGAFESAREVFIHLTNLVYKGKEIDTDNINLAFEDLANYLDVDIDKIRNIEGR